MPLKYDTPTNPENVVVMLSKLKQTVLNEDSREVMVAVKHFNRFLTHPEHWANNWEDRDASTL